MTQTAVDKREALTQPPPSIILMLTLLLVLVSAAVAADTLTITARQTVVRAGPDSKERILAMVPPGTTLARLETCQGWYKVLLDDGQEGWVAQSAAQVQDGHGITVVSAGGAAGPVRSALVIGNAAYSEDIGSLSNPGNDATDMAATLRQLGFAVTLVRDANHQRLAEAVETFSMQLRPGNATFMRGWRSPLRGLAPMQATGGSLVAHTTSPGAVAQDGTGRNGTYTRHLLRFMSEPNLPVELMFKQVRLAVEQETKGQQIPWELSSLRENFAFNPGAGGTMSTPTVVVGCDAFRRALLSHPLSMYLPDSSTR